MTHLFDRTEKYKHVIWDWNGTLVNDTHLAVEAACVLLEEYNLPLIDIAHYKEYFRFPVRDYYKLMGFDLEKISFEKLCERYVVEYNQKRSKLAKLFDGAAETLALIKKHKKQSILTAGEEVYVQGMVKHFDIHHYFDHVYGIHNHLAESKVYRGKELVEHSGILATDTILIGDTDHDLEVGQEMGVDVLLIADGHQSYERLSKVHDNVLESRYSNTTIK